MNLLIFNKEETLKLLRSERNHDNIHVMRNPPTLYSAFTENYFVYVYQK